MSSVAGTEERKREGTMGQKGQTVQLSDEGDYTGQLNVPNNAVPEWAASQVAYKTQTLWGFFFFFYPVYRNIHHDLGTGDLERT